MAVSMHRFGRHEIKRCTACGDVAMYQMSFGRGVVTSIELCGECLESTRMLARGWKTEERDS